MLRFLLPLLLLFSPSAGWAQLDVTPGRYLVEVRCTTPKPANGKIKYRWAAPSEIDAVPSATGKICCFAGPAGEYPVTCTVATSTAESLDLQEFTETIKLGLTPPPTPETLRSLVDDKEAVILAKYFRDFASVAERGGVDSVDQFWEAYNATFPPAGVTENPKLLTALTARLESSLRDLKTFPGSLQKISLEFGVEPGPTPDPEPLPDPDPVPNKAEKIWVSVIDKFETRNPVQASAITDTAYWRAKQEQGHDYEIYLQGSTDALRFSKVHKFEREAIVQDAITGKVLGVEEIPRTDVRAFFDSLFERYAKQ
jgi:hypothetical protein